MPEKSYTDGLAYCEAAGQTVTLRCSVKGVIICRGPENTRRYWKKCPSNSVYSCAVTMMYAKMKEEGREPSRRVKEPPPKPKALREVKAICKGTSMMVVISIYPGGKVECSIKGCEQRQSIFCPTRRIHEATEEIIATKMKLGRMKLTPEERNEAIATAVAKIQAIERNGAQIPQE